jgi:plasmid stabilization system protein ParE
MPKSRITAVLWTDRALRNAVSIKKYLQHNFSEAEINNFYSLLNAFEIAVKVFPELYPSSSLKRGIKKAVLSKVISVYYRVNKNHIEVLAVLDNRCDVSKWL